MTLANFFLWYGIFYIPYTVVLFFVHVARLRLAATSTTEELKKVTWVKIYRVVVGLNILVFLFMATSLFLTGEILLAICISGFLILAYIMAGFQASRLAGRLSNPPGMFLINMYSPGEVVLICIEEVLFVSLIFTIAAAIA